MNWRWIAFVVWLTDERRLALLPAGTIVRHPHHHESLTCREQGLNLCITWPVFWLSWMKLSSSDNHYMDFLHHCYGFFFFFFFLALMLGLELLEFLYCQIFRVWALICGNVSSFNNVSFFLLILNLVCSKYCFFFILLLSTRVFTRRVRKVTQGIHLLS